MPEKKTIERSRAVSGALKREGRGSASSKALSKQASAAAQERSPEDRRRTARKAVRTKGKSTLHAAAAKAAQTRSMHQYL